VDRGSVCLYVCVAVCVFVMCMCDHMCLCDYADCCTIQIKETKCHHSLQLCVLKVY
jgi:hypothetical protein